MVGGRERGEGRGWLFCFLAVMLLVAGVSFVAFGCDGSLLLCFALSLSMNVVMGHSVLDGNLLLAEEVTKTSSPFRGRKPEVTHTHLHMCTHAHARTRTHTHPHPHTHAHTHKHTNIHTHTLTLSLTHTHTHPHTHTNTRTHSLTHTDAAHTHTHSSRTH